jgi:hypothetical protein
MGDAVAIRIRGESARPLPVLVGCDYAGDGRHCAAPPNASRQLQVQPFVGAPQPCAPLFARLLLLEARGCQVLRHQDIHLDTGEHPFPPSLPRVAAQLILIERDTEAGPGRQVDPQIREAQRLLDEIVDEDLWAEMFAAPGQPAQPGALIFTGNPRIPGGCGVRVGPRAVLGNKKSQIGSTRRSNHRRRGAETASSPATTRTRNRSVGPRAWSTRNA